MYLSLNINEIDIHKIMFGVKMRNTIIENSDYYNIYYSNDIFTVNNIIIKLDLSNVTIEKFYNKYKCNITNFDETLNKLIQLENMIITTFKVNTIKTPVYRLLDQLNKFNFKVSCYKDIPLNELINIKLVFKISGVWENNNEYGIIYKFHVV